MLPEHWMARLLDDGPMVRWEPWVHDLVPMECPEDPYVTLWVPRVTADD